MENVTRVKDRITYEEGCIKEYLSNGWIRVEMAWGEIREYQQKDLIPYMELQQPELRPKETRLH
ncbi:MAG: hypothetical protein B0D91_08505 [Oceanospirillales bacterium LUC14_002_19_P2]|nr:MAG: hypothetical protein B0D91_08505 [Oceanospirillales bacterium LUC14_002_19_P2]